MTQEELSIVGSLYELPVKCDAVDAVVQISVIDTTPPVIEGTADLSEEYVRPMVEQVVSSVVTENMSDWDKEYALYYWCVENLSYSAEGIDGTMWEAAYQAIKKKQGDCYVYSGTYAALLTVAGIDNRMVYRVGGLTEHRWNLVNTGAGWYHCDSSPRRKGDAYICFMQTDSQVAVYTASYPEKPNYFVFDTTLYPERATAIVFGQ